MRKLLLVIASAVFLIINNSCTDQEVSTKDPDLTKDQIKAQTEGWIFYISDAVRKSDTETVHLTDDSNYNIFRNIIHVTFFEGGIYYFTGTDVTNDQFPATARTVSIRTRIMLPTNVKYSWDDTKNTYVFKSSRQMDPLPIPDGKEAFLDKSSFNLHKSFEEAKNAAVPGSMKVVLNEIDPKLGAVTYTFTLKPLWFYYQAPMDQNNKSFVIF
jgi:hypothetical protein